MCSFSTEHECRIFDNKLYRFIEVDGSRCPFFQNSHFEIFLLNVTIEVIIYEQNGERSFKLVVLAEDINMRQNKWSRKLADSSSLLNLNY